MQPARATGRISRKAVAESCTRTAKPAVLRRNASDWRTAASSSMTWTTLLFDKGRLLVLCRAQGEAEDRAAARPGIDPDPAAMRLDDGPADRQAQSHALALGGDERLEELRGDLGSKPGSGIGDAHFDRLLAACHGGDLELATLRGFDHGLDGVADQVDQDLLDLDAVGEHQVGRRVEPEGDLYAVLPGTDQGKRAGVLDQLGQAFDAALALATG